MIGNLFSHVNDGKSQTCSDRIKRCFQNNNLDSLTLAVSDQPMSHSPIPLYKEEI
ncbi:hypothetical protein [Gracilibacillus halophilus]|uniref:hypothetical protein n=1 Tax=Gracilibacillus halophilus TaxID=470864 RepID=UPI0003A13861|nr:hypothetical protein [Gracilibacillus halophilus]